MGLLDYYRQFNELTPEEVNEELHQRAAERKARQLARVEPVDLSHTTWPELPPSDVVNAVTFVARRGLQRYRDPHAGELRAELASALGVEIAQVVVGNGAAQLLAAAAHALLEAGDELITPWPSYPLYPLMARRARASAVPIAGFSADAILRAVNSRTRLVALCNPNDPTGELMEPEELRALLEGLPERVVVLLDEALADFADAPRDAGLGLLSEHPRLLVFRTFSKAWGLAGLRCGFAVGGADAGPLLERLEPDLGIADVSQAGALEALRVAGPVVARRVAIVREERERLTGELRALGFDVPDSHANVLWIAREGLDGAELQSRLGRAGAIVAAGGPLGDPARVRAAVQGRPAGERLLHAARTALELG